MGGGNLNFKKSPSFSHSSLSLFLKILSVLLLSVFLIAGCGGGSGDSGAGTGSGSGAKRISGKVVYSSSQSAKVCYDKNNDKKCSEGEAVVNVNSDGSYEIEGTKADFATTPLIAEIYDTQPESGKMLARIESSPAIVFETPLGQTNISSITTIIKSRMDMDPSLTPSDAEKTIKTSMELDEATDLFNPKPEVEKLANKVADVVKAMFKKLADEFEIEIKQSTILLVMNEVVGKLSDIKTKSTEEVVKSATGLTKGNAEEFNKIKTSVVQTAKVAFKDVPRMYEVNISDNKKHFTLYDIKASEIKYYKTDNEELPVVKDKADDNQPLNFDSNGAAVIENNNDGGGTASIATVTTVSLDNKELSAAPRTNSNNKVKFSPGAERYDYNIMFSAPEIDLEESRKVIKKNNSNNDTKESYKYAKVKEGAKEDELFEIPLEDGITYKLSVIMDKGNGSYFIATDNPLSAYYGELFPAVKTYPRGKYEKIKDGDGYAYEFKDTKGDTIFKVFKMDNDYWAVGYFDGGAVHVESKFNETAAKDIKDKLTISQ